DERAARSEDGTCREKTQCGDRELQTRCAEGHLVSECGRWGATERPVTWGRQEGRRQDPVKASGRRTSLPDRAAICDRFSPIRPPTRDGGTPRRPACKSYS